MIRQLTLVLLLAVLGCACSPADSLKGSAELSQGLGFEVRFARVERWPTFWQVQLSGAEGAGCWQGPPRYENYREVFLKFPIVRHDGQALTASSSTAEQVADPSSISSDDVLYIRNHIDGLTVVSTFPAKEQGHAVATATESGLSGRFTVTMSPGPDDLWMSGSLSGTFNAPFCPPQGAAL